MSLYRKQLYESADKGGQFYGTSPFHAWVQEKIINIRRNHGRTRNLFFIMVFAIYYVTVTSVSNSYSAPNRCNRGAFGARASQTRVVPLKQELYLKESSRLSANGVQLEA